MPNYENGVIYTIRCMDPEVDFIYVGSTVDFTNRKYNHKCACTNERHPQYNTTMYATMRDNGGWDNFIVKPYAKHPCNDKTELSIEEERVRVLLNANMNKNKAYSHLKGAAYQQQYYNDNKESILEYQKQYNEENKDLRSEYHKQYRTENKERLREYFKEYYQNKKQKTITV